MATPSNLAVAREDSWQLESNLVCLLFTNRRSEPRSVSDDAIMSLPSQNGAPSIVGIILEAGGGGGQAAVCGVPTQIVPYNSKSNSMLCCIYGRSAYRLVYYKPVNLGMI